MAKLLNANYWKNAYLLEFKINGTLTDAFTFSVPPENEEFVFPQRKSETKTFGGGVVADYGNDFVQINLSGSTINQELKIIYKSRLGVTNMTGEQEIFYLRDLLKKYGMRDKLQNKEVYLYSLNGGGTKTTHNPKWWKIYVGQLDVSRNKDKPFCYNYKFTATGVPEVTRKKTNVFSKIKDKLDNFTSGFQDTVAEMTRIADKVEEYGGGFIEELSGYIGNLRSCIDIFNAASVRYVSVLSGIIDDSSYLVTDTLALGDTVLFSAVRYVPTIIDDLWNSSKNLVDAANNFGNYCANLDETFEESYWYSIKELFDDSVSEEDIADAISTLGHDEIILANSVETTVSKSLNDIGIAVIPGEMNENDKVITTYGYKVVALTDAETSWDQLAQDYYGDSSLSNLLATYNNLPTDQPLKAGQSILIPNLNMADSKTSENEVYNSPDVKDNYGKDLFIDNKDFGIYNGDLALIDGVKNLEQALLNRYSTLVGARIRIEAYGIQASIGDALSATSALIQASVHQTTVEDPRVDSVEDISFQGKGDSLTVMVIYIDKNGSKRNFGGTI